MRLCLVALAFALLVAVPAAQAEWTGGAGGGPFDEECGTDTVQFGCTHCSVYLPCHECQVWKDRVSGSAWGIGAMFDAGLCVFIDCAPVAPCGIPEAERAA